MLKLYQVRQRAYLKQIFKYLRYVLNDFFVLSLLFAFGGLGLAYSNYLKALKNQPTPSYAPYIMAVILTLVIQFGQLKTLLKPADAVFLLPKEGEIRRYLTRAKRASLVTGVLFTIGCSLVLVPFLLFILKFDRLQVTFICLTAIVLKYFWLSLEEFTLYFEMSKGIKFLLYVVYPFINFLIAALGLGVYALTFSLVGCLLIFIWRQSMGEKQIFLWQQAIGKESSRMMNLYRFFNLFCDVPYVVTSAKRRKYLDFMLPKAHKKRPYYYLFARGLVRSGSFGSLFFRLLVLGGLLLCFLENRYLALLIALIFTYLICFQMGPLKDKYNEIVFTHLYPLTQTDKTRDFAKLMRILMLVVVLLFTICYFAGTRDVKYSLVTGILLLLESYALLKRQSKEK